MRALGRLMETDVECSARAELVEDLERQLTEALLTLQQRQSPSEPNSELSVESEGATAKTVALLSKEVVDLREKYRCVRVT